MATAEARNAVVRIAAIICESVAEAGSDGCPESAIYLALQQFGATVDQHRQMIDALIAIGRIRRENPRLYAVL